MAQTRTAGGSSSANLPEGNLPEDWGATAGSPFGFLMQWSAANLPIAIDRIGVGSVAPPAPSSGQASGARRNAGSRGILSSPMHRTMDRVQDRVQDRDDARRSSSVSLTVSSGKRNQRGFHNPADSGNVSGSGNRAGSDSVTGSGKSAGSGKSVDSDNLATKARGSRSEPAAGATLLTGSRAREYDRSAGNPPRESSGASIALDRRDQYRSSGETSQSRSALAAGSPATADGLQREAGVVASAQAETARGRQNSIPGAEAEWPIEQSADLQMGRNSNARENAEALEMQSAAYADAQWKSTNPDAVPVARTDSASESTRAAQSAAIPVHAATETRAETERARAGLIAMATNADPSQTRGASAARILMESGPVPSPVGSVDGSVLVAGARTPHPGDAQFGFDLRIYAQPATAGSQGHIAGLSSGAPGLDPGATLPNSEAGSGLPGAAGPTSFSVAGRGDSASVADSDAGEVSLLGREIRSQDPTGVAQGVRAESAALALQGAADARTLAYQRQMGGEGGRRGQSGLDGYAGLGRMPQSGVPGRRDSSDVGHDPSGPVVDPEEGSDEVLPGLPRQWHGARDAGQASLSMQGQNRGNTGAGQGSASGGSAPAHQNTGMPQSLGRTALSQSALPETASPDHALADLRDSEGRTLSAARSILVKLPTELRGEPVQLRFLQRGTQLDVRIASPSISTAQELREQLPALLSRLQQAGFSSEKGNDLQPGRESGENQVRRSFAEDDPGEELFREGQWRDDGQREGQGNGHQGGGNRHHDPHPQHAGSGNRGQNQFRLASAGASLASGWDPARAQERGKVQEP